MKMNLEHSWKQVLKDEFEKQYFIDLLNFIDGEYSNYQCFPTENQIFEAFNTTPFAEVKVVILGQDPYHGEGQAHGLSFSVNNNVAIPPSLRNIYKEIKEDIGAETPNSGNLTRWANQGVLLLNATLTVRAHKAGSHQKKGWEKFTDAVIEKLSVEREGLVFMFWGGPAKKKGAKVDASKHLVLTGGHPSPLSANRGYWFGNKHFSNANSYLKKNGYKPIDW